MSHDVGADERRMRKILIDHGVGPSAPPPPPVDEPAARERDWLDDILDSPTPAPVPEPRAVPPVPEPVPAAEMPPPPAPPARSQRKRRKARQPEARHAPLARPNPRQSLADAYGRVPPRMRWLVYHASTAYLGWTVGLIDWTTYVTGWIATTGLIGPQAVLWYATGAATLLLHHRTRGWWWPVSWLAAVPASSTVVGVLLYAPTP